jgi:LacI family transcriptional regulator
MGVAAAKALIRQIEGLPPLAPAPKFTATLVRRGSVGPRRATEARGAKVS